MVIMSIEIYDEMAARLKMYQSLLISEQQIREGKVQDAVSNLEDMREKYGL